MNRSLKIPKTVSFPFGYRIRVQKLNKAEWKQKYRVRYPPLGRWLHQERLILLNADRPAKCQRADLIHELGHAFQDWQSDLQWSRKVDLKS